MSWTCTLDVAAASDLPVFQRIAEAVIADIRRGRLAPGDRLPGTRELATTLGVNRNTVQAAYRELSAQGWTEGRAGAGTRVAALPTPAPAATQPRSEPVACGFPLDPPPGLAVAPEPPRGALVLAGGRPDLRLVPVTEIARAWRRGIRNSGHRLLAYGDSFGHERLRQALSAMLAARRGLVIDEGGLLVTRGSQMALYLVARCLLRPGDRVAVEAWGYGPAWHAFRAAGAELVPVSVDTEGLVVDDLARRHAEAPVRMVYLTPHHQFPTMVTMSAGRRLALLALARDARMAVIEDDYDNEFHYRGRPVLPLAAADRSGVVVYVGTLSKVLAPGLRLGWAVGPPALLSAMAAMRVGIDRQGDRATEYAVAELIEEGLLARHLRRALRTYAERQQALVTALHHELGPRLSFEVPAGGLALWVEAPGVDVDAWSRAARARGVWFETARAFHVDGMERPFVRLGFGSLRPEELEQAVARLHAALPESRA